MIKEITNKIKDPEYPVVSLPQVAVLVRLTDDGPAIGTPLIFPANGPSILNWDVNDIEPTVEGSSRGWTVARDPPGSPA